MKVKIHKKNTVVDSDIVMVRWKNMDKTPELLSTKMNKDWMLIGIYLVEVK